MDRSRRKFLGTAVLSSASMALSSTGSTQMHPADHAQHSHAKPERPALPRLPALICKPTSTIAIDAAFQMLVDGGDTLDAVMHVCKAQEDDPRDHTTGLGGLPNSEGEVQLDACCVHGPTRRFGAVSSVSRIRNASLLAQSLLQQTGGMVLVGADAHKFAKAHGFITEDLLTERTRKNYELWKQIASAPNKKSRFSGDPLVTSSGDALPTSQAELDALIHTLEPLALQAGLSPETTWRAVFTSVAPSSEPLYLSAIDAKGRISAASTSSGRPWRMPGLCSDVAMIGAGCFVDPDVGSAGSSGNAEANIKVTGAHTIVENMRMGMSPEEAGLDALRRIVRAYNNDVSALRQIEMVYYILRKDGAYGSVSLWSGDRTGHSRQFTIMDGQDMRRTDDCVSLFPCSPMNGCASPKA